MIKYNLLLGSALTLLLLGNGCVNAVGRDISESNDMFDKKMACATQASWFMSLLRDQSAPGFGETHMTKLCYSSVYNSCVALVETRFFNSEVDDHYLVQLYDELTAERISSAYTADPLEEDSVRNGILNKMHCIK